MIYAKTNEKILLQVAPPEALEPKQLARKKSPIKNWPPFAIKKKR